MENPTNRPPEPGGSVSKKQRRGMSDVEEEALIIRGLVELQGQPFTKMQKAEIIVKSVNDRGPADGVQVTARQVYTKIDNFDKKYQRYLSKIQLDGPGETGAYEQLLVAAGNKLWPNFGAYRSYTLQRTDPNKLLQAEWQRLTAQSNALHASLLAFADTYEKCGGDSKMAAEIRGMAPTIHLSQLPQSAVSKPLSDNQDAANALPQIAPPPLLPQLSLPLPQLNQQKADQPGHQQQPQEPQAPEQQQQPQPQQNRRRRQQPEPGQQQQQREGGQQQPAASSGAKDQEEGADAVSALLQLSMGSGPPTRGAGGGLQGKQPATGANGLTGLNTEEDEAAALPGVLQGRHAVLGGGSPEVAIQQLRMMGAARAAEFVRQADGPGCCIQ